MFQLSTSFREIQPERTIVLAQQFAATLGVTRVTNITRLDCIGIPVFVSIRPDAAKGSLCVNAGKGLFEQEAKVGALMEAIEYAIAEHSSKWIPILRGTPRDVLDGDRREEAILDFCPFLNTKIDINLPLSLVEAEDLLSQTLTLVPAKLVFLPFLGNEEQDRLFPANSNGLAAGNTIEEATVHAILEIIERDVISFQLFQDTSSLLKFDSLPETASFAVKAIKDAGLSLYIRTVPNVFNVAHFSATIIDLANLSPLYINGGYGCHIDPSVALTRAICEAAQSRLSFIHGARDDLLITAMRFADWDSQTIESYVAERMQELGDTKRVIEFDEIASLSFNSITSKSLLSLLLDMLLASGIESICRIVLTKKTDPVQVVRVIIPKMENFDQNSNRLGVRLKNYVESL